MLDRLRAVLAARTVLVLEELPERARESTTSWPAAGTGPRWNASRGCPTSARCSASATAPSWRCWCAGPSGTTAWRRGVSLNRSLLDAALVGRLRRTVEVVMTWPIDDLETLDRVVGRAANGIIAKEPEILR